MQNTIHTARLTLRPPVPADADWIAREIARPAVHRMLTAPPHPYRREHALDWIARAGAGERTYVIETAEGPAGSISLPSGGEGGALGYWLAEAFWGRGLMTEAAAAAVQAWFDAGHDRLVSGHLADNHASRAVLTKLGFDAGEITEAIVPQRGAAVPLHRMSLDRGTWARHPLRPFVVTTERLRLRPLTCVDAPALARIGGRPEVAPMIFIATVPWPEADAAALIAADRWQGRLGFRLGIEARQGGPLLGMIGVSAEPSIFYFLDPSAWGRGLAGEAVAAFAAAVFDRLEPAALGAEVFTDNPASARVLERAGFQRAGEALRRSRARLEPAPVWLYRLTRSLPAEPGP